QPADAIAQHIDDALQEFGEQRDDVAVLVLSGTGDDTAAASVLGAAEEPAA
ncbi:MAG: hypothetical protein QOF86_2054, partial [Baekduia sp.]|nr:hypothetical protein [Baekduia sp.]